MSIPLDACDPVSGASNAMMIGEGAAEATGAATSPAAEPEITSAAKDATETERVLRRKVMAGP